MQRGRGAAVQAALPRAESGGVARICSSFFQHTLGFLEPPTTVHLPGVK